MTRYSPCGRDVLGRYPVRAPDEPPCLRRPLSIDGHACAGADRHPPPCRWYAPNGDFQHWYPDVDPRGELMVASACPTCGELVARAAVRSTLAVLFLDADADGRPRPDPDGELVLHGGIAREVTGAEPPGEVRYRRHPHPASFLCPACARRSYNDVDIRTRYCGRCHESFPADAERML
jgi:hypothetical protein